MVGGLPCFPHKNNGKREKTAKTPTGAPAVDMSRHQYLFSVKLGVGGGWVWSVRFDVISF